MIGLHDEGEEQVAWRREHGGGNRSQSLLDDHAVATGLLSDLARA